MARATNGKQHHKKAKRVLKDAKGYRGARSKLFRTAKDARRRALQNSYKDRRRKKRDMRSLWIVRISAAAKICGTNYSTLIYALNKANIQLNRKMLSEIAIKDFETFKSIVDKAISASA